MKDSKFDSSMNHESSYDNPYVAPEYPGEPPSDVLRRDLLSQGAAMALGVVGILYVFASFTGVTQIGTLLFTGPFQQRASGLCYGCLLLCQSVFFFLHRWTASIGCAGVLFTMTAAAVVRGIARGNPVSFYEYFVFELLTLICVSGVWVRSCKEWLGSEGRRGNR